MQDVNVSAWGLIPGLGRRKVDTICIEPPRGVTLPCREHWQVLVTQQNNQKVSLMPKLNSATAGIQTADPWVIESKPDALTSQ